MDPSSPPLINPNYMSHERDWVEFRRCIEIARSFLSLSPTFSYSYLSLLSLYFRDVFSQPSMSEYVDYEAVPGIDAQTDQELDEFVKKYAESSYHLCGSCKMGRYYFLLFFHYFLFFKSVHVK